MASDVSICNLALSHLGNAATVSVLSPPDSREAELCASFYPIARDAMIEEHNWAFTMRRRNLQLLAATPPSEWAYVYAVPDDVVNTIAVLAPDATDDNSSAVPGAYPSINGYAMPAFGNYTPQDYSIETLEDATKVLYTNQVNAVLRCTVLITDPNAFSPLFVVSLSHLLASHLAGPLIKGETGVAAATTAYKAYEMTLAKAQYSDASQRRVRVQPQTPWIQGR
jgi:hypothetical protein